MVGRRAVGILSVLVAVLLCGAVAAALTVDEPARDRRGRVGAAGLSRSALVDDGAAGRTLETTLPVAPPTSTTSTTTRPSPTTSAPAPAPTRTTLGGTSPTMPLPAGPPPTGIPNIAPASSWSSERDGVTARMRMDPAAPVAGQPITFFVDVSSAEPCCTILLDLGDGKGGFGLNTSVPCGSLTPGAKSAQTTHTFAAAGAYKATLTVMTGMACQPPLEPGQAPSLPVFHSVSLNPCIAVGPGTAGQAGCSPFPQFAPDQLVSPVIDPFCQIRSDCTKASPPR